MSSAACVAAVRRQLPKGVKVGHTGTLDPFATGLLPLAIGRATRAIRHLPESPKVYRATLRLGEETDTLDCEGSISRLVPIPDTLSEARIVEAANALLGPQRQIPPLYSAIKVHGRRLYRHARAGTAEGLPLPPRCIEIFRWDSLVWMSPHLDFTVAVSPGTYVRALGRDLAYALGTVGHLVALRRLESNGFSLAQAVSLDFIRETPPTSWPLR